MTIDDISYGTPNRIDKDFFENVKPGIADIARVLLGLIFIRNRFTVISSF